MSIKYYELYTLVDITDTGDTNPTGNTKEYRQNQNLQTLIQSLGMRAQIFVDDVSIKTDKDSKLNFGEVYSGKLKYWRMRFSSDINDPWKKEDDEFFFAMNDLNNTPVYNGLDEKIYNDGLLISFGELKNTYIKILSNS